MEPFLSDIAGLACESARAWASQALDGELSDLEQAALEAHLVDCAGCEQFVFSMNAATLALREARPLEPEQPLVGAPAGGRATGRRLALVAAAAAVAASVLLGGAIGTFTRHSGSGGAAAAGAPGGFLATQQPYREQSLLALLPRLHQRASRVVAV